MGVCVTGVERQSMIVPSVKRYLHAIVVGHGRIIDERYIRQIRGAYVLWIKRSARTARCASTDSCENPGTSTWRSKWPGCLLGCPVGPSVRKGSAAIVWRRIGGT